MAAILAFLQGHGLAVLVVAFTILSIVLDTVAKVFAALGKVAPGWVGSIAGVVSQILHFLNGNLSGASNSQPPAAS